jgi:phage head maturation protease
MRFYWPIAKVDREQRMVWGYASTEAEDDQGEVIRREALDAALADYMRFANIREMHQPSAVGVAPEAAVDDRGLYLGARIVDAEAWRKVTEGVYKGFSIGGRVTARDPGDRKVITGLSLTEISVVDRPANPEAVFDCWKAASPAAEDTANMTDHAPRHEPVQIWDCGTAGHRHLAKAEAAQCMARRAGMSPADPPDPVEYADPGYQADGRKRYPIDTEEHIRAAWAYIHQPGNARHYTEGQLARIEARIVAAWRERIDPHGPPAAAVAPTEHATPAELAPMALADTLRKSWQPDLAPLGMALAKLADDLMPRLDALQQRVDEIARTPLPPLTMTRGIAALAKRDDGNGGFTSPDDVVAALARMSDEERTLALIKAAHATPIAPRGRPRRLLAITRTNLTSHPRGRACPGHPRLEASSNLARKTWMPGTRPGTGYLQ